MSMTADVCDLDELNYGLPRKEATFGAIYWLMVKFGYAIAGLLSGLIMSLVGFDPNASEQPEGAIFLVKISVYCPSNSGNPFCHLCDAKLIWF